MSPITVNTLLAVQIIVMADLLALIIGALEVAPVDVIVTPLPAARVVNPAPIDWTLICSPAAKTEGGTVRVIAEALDVVTSLPESEATRV
jgi:hypothetical protein